ncbi:YkvA family protein [Brevibacillus ginsengisoli]|uniref:YkvA family protein n=1 Tax=Brevibacillus ginsengisoli TaxID=363854 RepID=UPI003CF29283
MSDSVQQGEKRDTQEEATKQTANLPAILKKEPVELVPIEIPEEHQRFYDKLRKKIEAYIREKGVKDSIAQYILLAPDLFVLLARLLADKRVPMQAKTIAGIAIAYFISPIDFIPEALLGPLGLTDDVVLAVYALRKILVDVDEWIVREHWNGQDDLLEVITRVIKSADNLIGKKVLNKIQDVLFGKKR